MFKSASISKVATVTRRRLPRRYLSHADHKFENSESRWNELAGTLRTLTPPYGSGVTNNPGAGPDDRSEATGTGRQWISGIRSRLGPAWRLANLWLAACWRGGASTQRKPLFLFLFSGSFLFRLVARRFLDVLLKEPPRNTRDTPSAFGLADVFSPSVVASARGSYGAKGALPTAQLAADGVDAHQHMTILLGGQPAAVGGKSQEYPQPD